MRIYFAGPLFTPYVREFISRHAQILRDNGIDPFVPHENFRPIIPTVGIRFLVEHGWIQPQDADDPRLPDRANDWIRGGQIKPQDLGMPELTPGRIFEVDYGGLSSADAVVVLLDGTQVDDGTACELGIFYGLLRQDASKKGIVGFMTDSRGTRKASTNWGLNLFVLGLLDECGKIFTQFDDVVRQLKQWDAER